MSKDNLNVADLTDEDLVRQFEYTVRYWHYDPHSGNPEPKFDLDDLRDQLFSRMQSKETHWNG